MAPGVAILPVEDAHDGILEAKNGIVNKIWPESLGNSAML
jgi:hypothetical protein